MGEQMRVNFHLFGTEKANFPQEQLCEMPGFQIQNTVRLFVLTVQNNPFAHLEFGIDPIIYQIVLINIPVEFVLDPDEPVDLVVIRLATHPPERLAALEKQSFCRFFGITDDAGIKAEAVFGFGFNHSLISYGWQILSA